VIISLPVRDIPKCETDHYSQKTDSTDKRDLYSLSLIFQMHKKQENKAYLETGDTKGYGNVEDAHVNITYAYGDSCEDKQADQDKGQLLVAHHMLDIRICTHNNFSLLQNKIK
jgi:hypothetical protein